MTAQGLIVGLTVATILAFFLVLLVSAKKNRQARQRLEQAASPEQVAVEEKPLPPGVYNRKYLVIAVLSWAFVMLVGFNAVREPARQKARQTDAIASYIDAGAKLYALNCVTCHGPAGEGHIGPPLNNRTREGFAQGDWDAEKGMFEMDEDAYKFIRDTIASGRAGSSDTTWVRLPAEPGAEHVFASYTNMPAWSVAHEGPFTEQQVDQVATFLMYGNAKPYDGFRTGWQRVSSYIPQPVTAEDGGKFPETVVGLTDAEKAEAERLVDEEYGCTACHVFGSIGGFVGPDLTKAGTWGMDAEFLRDWVYDAPNTTYRMPTYFSNYSGPFTDPAEAGASPLLTELPPTLMPSFKETMSQDDLELIVRYLLGLQ